MMMEGNGISGMSDNSREKFTLTINKGTAEWLENEYDEALELQEAVRMAIQDCRDYREATEGLDIEMNREKLD